MDGPSQSRDRVTQAPSRNREHANARIEQRAQRAFVAQHQDREPDALGEEGIAKQDHVALRAAAFEGAHHHRKAASRNVGW